MVCTWNECVKRVAASQAQTSSLRADTLHWVKFFGWMRLAFREQLVVLMHRVPEGLPCPFTSGHCFFFRSPNAPSQLCRSLPREGIANEPALFGSWYIVYRTLITTCLLALVKNKINTTQKTNNKNKHNTNQNPKTTKTDPAKNTNQTFWPRAMPAKMVSVKPWTLYRHA